MATGATLSEISTELSSQLNAQNTYNKVRVETQSTPQAVGLVTAKLTCGTGVSGDYTYYEALTSTGKFKINIDGAGLTDVNPDFTSAGSMSGVAAAIQAAMRTAFSDSSVCTWSTDHFILTSGTAGGGAMTYMTTPTTGTDLSSILGGRSTSTAVDLIAAGEAAAARTAFTISGGRVKVLSITGVVGTVIQTQTDATKLQFTPTGGSAGDLCATLDITAKASGSKMYLTAPGSAMVNSATLALPLTVPYILGTGTVIVNAAANNTGSVTWTVEYLAIDSGATVIAANID